MEINNDSKTIISRDGKILFFGYSDFINCISKGDNCFICGAFPKDKNFNNEHVIPNWILSKYGLYDKEITLINGSSIKYGQYKIPCCEECNSDLGLIFEQPISNLFSMPYESIINAIKADGEIEKLLFKWLSLIFIKTHVKDKTLLSERDLRKGESYLSERYSWEFDHHIHCIARSHYSRAYLAPFVYGTILFFQTIDNEMFGKFDYCDFHLGKVVMIKLNDICIIVVLDDAKVSGLLFRDYLRRINGPLTPFQVKEIVSHLAFLNIHLMNRPVFYSDIGKNYIIKAKVPEILDIVEKNERIVNASKILHFFVKDFMGNIDNKEQILNEIKSGKRNFLFDEKDKFISHGA
jgi:hypothetical protein